MHHQSTPIPFPKEHVSRFWSKVDKSGGSESCWPWTGSRDGYDYGYFYAINRAWRAHRLAWILTNGRDAGPLCVCHSCDNPACCNPAHLWTGTNEENRKDSKNKDRVPRGNRHGMFLHPESRCVGERNGSAKLTADQVRSIRREYRSGLISQRALARAYSVHQTTIWQVVNGTKWTSIKDEVTTT